MILFVLHPNSMPSLFFFSSQKKAAWITPSRLILSSRAHPKPASNGNGQGHALDREFFE